MSQSSGCPDIKAYERLLAGRFPPDEVDALIQHLEACAQCADRVQTLNSSDTLLDTIPSAGALVRQPQDEIVRQVIARLSKLRFVMDGTVPEKAPVEAAHIMACPGCGHKFKVKAELLGKKVRCGHCQKIVETARPVATPSVTRSEAASVISPSELEQGEEDWREILAPAMEPGELGRLGPYRVLSVLGAGGMGVVFKAEDPHLQRPVALKAMLPVLAARASSRHRFVREARAAAALRHDHIVAIYQVGEDRNIPFLAMEFLEGESLDQRLSREAILPLADAVRIAREIAEGLAAAHERNLVHRDIKPANIWLESRPSAFGFRQSASVEPPSAENRAPKAASRVKILDFGLARSTNDDNSPTLTQQGSIVGTPGYMAPEQAQGEAIDHRCDLFSLGCVLYRLVTGNTPWRGVDAVSTLLAMITTDPVPPEKLNPEVPPSLSELIMKLLAKNAADRPGSATDVIQALEKVEITLAKSPAKAREEKPSLAKRLLSSATSVVLRTPELLTIPKREKLWRHPGIIAGACLATVVLIATIYLSGFLASQQTPAPLLEAKADTKLPAEKEPDNERPSSEQRDMPAEPPKPLPAKARAAWKAAGAVIGWMAWTDGELSFRPDEVEGRAGELAAFAFYKAAYIRFGDEFDLAKLGDPGQPFGLVLRMPPSNQKVLDGVPLAGVGKLDHLTALKLDFDTTLVTPYFDVDVHEIAQLKGLQSLSIKGKWFTDAQMQNLGLPAKLRNLSQLQNLGFLGTKVTEVGLKDLVGLKLKRLEIPAQARTDLGLKYYLSSTEPSATLNLQGWNLSDEGLLYLRTQKQLKWLNLAGTKVTDVGLADLASLMELQTLDLGGTKLSGAGLKQLAGLGQLRSLSVAATRAAEGDFKVLASLENLQSLNLSETQATDFKLRELAEFKQLQSLDLSSTKVTDSAIKELVGLKKLQSLDLANTELTGMGLNRLEGLKHLNLGRAQVTSAGTKELSELRHLRSLDLSKTRATDAWLKDLVSLKQLQTLNLTSTQVTNAGVEELRQSLPALRIEFGKDGK